MDGRKVVRIDKRAEKEIEKFPNQARAKIHAALIILSRDGKLEEPFGKKINSRLFEIRIKHLGQWRVIYTYVIENYIIVLSAFQKKTQKTPQQEVEKANKRLKEYGL